MSRSRAPLLASSVFLFALLATLLPSLGRAQTAGHVVISEVRQDLPGAEDTATATSTMTETDTPTIVSDTTPTVTPAATQTFASVTGMPTPTNTPPPTSSAGVYLNEILPAPKIVDWDGNGTPGASDEWIEIVNLGPAETDLGGWVLDDVEAGGSAPYVIPNGTIIHPSAFLLIFQAQSHIELNNSGDTVRLIEANGGEVDTFAFISSRTDASYSRSMDGVGEWTDAYPPSPGRSNQPGPPAPTTTVTSSRTPTAIRTPTPSRTPTVTRTPSSTPTSASTPSIANPGDVVINEIMQNPSGDEPDCEWFEIYNLSGRAIDLNGWTIKDDASKGHKIAYDGSLPLPVDSYLVLGYRAKTPCSNGVSVAYQYTSFGLNNGKDEIIVWDGAGNEIDRVTYDGGPAFPDPDGASMQLIRPHLDNSSGANWRVSPDPWPGSAGDRGSPGAPNHTARIEGYVYEDLNGDRARDAGEPGIAGVLISLNTGRTTRSIASGWYGFADLAPGAYEVIETQPIGYTSTRSDRGTVTVALGELAFGPSFGERRLPPTETPTPGPSPTPTPSLWPRLLLSEVLYDAPQGGTDSAYEWIEIYNPGDAAVSLAGWAVSDNGGWDALPEASVAPGEYLVIAATAAGFRTNYPDFTGKLLSLEGTIGNGLSNTSDVVHLLAPDAAIVDALSYGENTAAFAPPCPNVPAGRSLARVPAWNDTDTAADWAPQAIPNPSGPGVGPMLTPTPTPTELTGATATPTPTATITPAPTPTPTAGPLPFVRLNEILPRPDAVDWDGSGAVDAYDEWIEIINLGPGVADLAGWALDDIPGGGSAAHTFPPGTRLGPGEFLVRYRSTTGVALNQDADTATLLGPDGSVVDSFSYTAPGRDASYSRAVDGTGDWTETYPPSPGGPNLPGTPAPTGTPTPTSTPTATPTAVGTPTPTPIPSLLPLVRLNEILPRPDAVDWDGSGAVDAYDGWIEVINLDTETIDLGGWALDDIPGGTRPYVFPGGTLLEPSGLLVRYRSTTGVALNQDADTARLLAPDGREVDVFAYRNPGRDASYSRATDGTGDWTDSYPPSPGGSNLPGAPTRTPTATATPSQTPTTVAYDRTALRLNEVLPAPSEIDWNGDGAANTDDEWVEIYSRGSAPIDLGGWLLDDIAAGGSAPYTIPTGTLLQPGGFLVLFRDRTGVALNNDGDTVRLLGPDAAEADAFVYVKARNDRSYSRTTGGDGPWTDTYPPSPGRANIPATPTPTPTATPTSTPFPAGVTLNELLPDPQRADWDQDGVANFADEWIEVYNGSPAPAALGGWAVLDDTKAYTLPMGLTIWPGSYLLLYRRETGLSLSDWRDRVTLARPDGSTADQFAYDRGPGADRSFCRSMDGSGAWTTDCEVTPGQSNRLRPHSSSGGGGSGATSAQPTRSPRTGAIAAARAAPDDTRVTVTGAVTLPPGLYGRNIYLQDATGGIKVYLRSGDYPALAAGDRVRVTGWTRQYHGEVELSVPGPSYLTRLGPGEPPHPVYVRTGQVGEAHEGKLVWIAGRVVKFEPGALTLDDGTGPARIFFPAELPWRRPYVEIGEFWSAQGVVGQYAFEAPWEGGYRVIPRFKSDVSDAPMVLPVTGGG